MAKRSNGGEGNSGALVFGSKASFFWGLLAGVALSVAVCTLCCGGHRCGWGMCKHGGMSGCTYGDKAPAPEGKTAPAK